MTFFNKLKRFFKRLFNEIIKFDIKGTKKRAVAYLLVTGIFFACGTGLVINGAVVSSSSQTEKNSNYLPDVRDDKIQATTEKPSQKPDMIAYYEEKPIPEPVTEPEPSDPAEAKSKIAKNFSKQKEIVAVEKENDKYEAMKIQLTAIDRDILERTIAAYSTNETSACIMGQLIRDNWIYHKLDSASSAIMESGCDKNADKVEKYVKKAVKRIFDNGEIAVKHRILYFYNPNTQVADEYENQVYVLTYGSYKFFDQKDPESQKKSE